MEREIENAFQFCETPLDLDHPETPVYPTVPLPSGWQGSGEWDIQMLYDHTGRPDMVVWCRRIYREIVIP
jgi:hypothetical protein